MCIEKRKLWIREELGMPFLKLPYPGFQLVNHGHYFGGIHRLRYQVIQIMKLRGVQGGERCCGSSANLLQRKGPAVRICIGQERILLCKWYWSSICKFSALPF
jgi:hypothetical protein